MYRRSVDQSSVSSIRRMVMMRRADSIFGNMSTTRVRRRMSRLRCSTGFVVTIFRQCFVGKP